MPNYRWIRRPYQKAGPSGGGAGIFANMCGTCHGDSAIAGGLNPDLRHSAALGNPKLWREVAPDGLLRDNGMVGWSRNFTPDQMENVRQYVIKRANEDKALGEK